jgi:hypothetical protein
MSDATEFVEGILDTGYSGWVCFGRIDPKQTAKTRNFRVNVDDWFQWPGEQEKINSFVDEHKDDDLYMCPMLFNSRRRTKENVIHTAVLWVDADTADPDTFDLAPSVRVETSPGRYQAYWLLVDTVRPDWAEGMSKRITYSKRKEGSDTGWNLGKYLRVPGTTNNKYATPFTVQMQFNGEAYTTDEIERVYGRAEIPALAGMDREFPKVLPARAVVLAKVPYDRDVERALMEPPLSDSWSETLWWLECELFRMGLTPPEVFVMTSGCACDKYERDGRPITDLWREVLRAEGSVARQVLTGIEPRPDDDLFELEAPKFLTSAEREGLPRTFIDQYVEWVSTHTHADRGYQELGAVVVMATVLGDFGMAVPSFGDLNLNMFVMIMGVTTRTYKTTSRQLMLGLLRLLQDDQFDYDLGSDATSEGIITELGDRDGRSVLYHRDEVNALFAGAKGAKNYLVGFIEFLTEAFDGWIRGKLRSTGAVKKQPTVRSSFNAYMAGVPDKIGLVLTPEDFASGFLPRFLFCLGRPEAPNDSTNHIGQRDLADNRSVPQPLRDALHVRLADVRGYWAKRTSPGVQVPIVLTPAALDRLNAFITDLDTLARATDQPDIFEPCANRMNKSVLKLVCLLAMMDKRDTANTNDVLVAVSYAERWWLGLNQAVSIVGRNAFAAQVDGFIGWIRSQRTVSYADARGRYKNLLSRDFEEMLKSALDQQHVTLTYAGGAKVIQAL